MSLYHAKCKAIRQTLISGENSEKLTWKVVSDNECRWMAEDNDYESWVEVTIYKKPLM